MSRRKLTFWSSFLLFIAASATASCASDLGGPTQGSPPSTDQTPGLAAPDDSESLASEDGNPLPLTNTPIQVLRPPVVLARIPGLGDFDFEGGTLVYGVGRVCSIPGCTPKWTLSSFETGTPWGPSRIAQGRAYYPDIHNQQVQIRSIGLGGEGDRLEATTTFTNLLGVPSPVTIFGGDTNQIADVLMNLSVGGSDFQTLSVSPPVGRISSIPKANKLRHTNGDGSIELQVVDARHVTFGPAFINAAVTVPDWPAGGIDEIATSPRTVAGAPVPYPAVGMVEHSGGSQNVRVCPTATDCAAWISVGPGSSINFTGTHLYIGSSAGLDRCKLSEIGRFGTCTREALVRGGPATSLYITETHVVYKSGTQILAACRSPGCSSNTCLDWLKNGKETDVDCGGSCARRCDFGRTCKVHSDCTTNKCSSGTCVVGAAEVSMGTLYACTQLLDGRIKCWGFNNNYGQLGLGHTNQPVNTPTPLDLGQRRTAIDISARYNHACAVFDDNTVKCWGSNAYGQLGTGDTTDLNAPGAAVNLGAGLVALSVATGGGYSCALLHDRTVKCWGGNSSGQLGIGNTTNRSAPGPVARLGSGRTALQIATGGGHSCAILDNATLKCWGYNGSGQLGVGTTVDRSVPGLVRLGAGRTASSVALGMSHSCAILDNGKVKCWGDNTRGQLGVGNNTNLEAPGAAVNLGPGRTAKAIALGDLHTCALLDNDSVKCWGLNIFNILGVGGSADLNAPGAAVDFGPGALPKAIGLGNRGTCVVMDDDSLRCWGFGVSGAGAGPTVPVDLGR